MATVASDIVRTISSTKPSHGYCSYNYLCRKVRVCNSHECGSAIPSPGSRKTVQLPINCASFQPHSITSFLRRSRWTFGPVGPTVETKVRPGVNVGSRPHLEKMQRTGIYAAFFLASASAFFAAASAFFVSASTCLVLNVGLSL
jgi:hypothetical protein